MSRPTVRLALLLLALLCACAEPEAEEWQPQAPEFQKLARRIQKGDNPYFGTGLRRRLTRLVEDPETQRARRQTARVRLGRVLLKAGDIELAIRTLEEARESARGVAAAEDRLLPYLALAYLRLAETQNCVERHVAECCIFPLRGGALHTRREPAEKARDVYLEILRRAPDDLESRWLLNVCAMALGEYPAGLPESLLIGASPFASGGELARFVDVAPELGIAALNLCGGVVVEDFDGDGFFDILTSTFDPLGPLTFYRADGAGGFEDRSEASHASDQLGGLNLIAADYDGDGDVDAFVLRGAWMSQDGRIRNSLLRNGHGVFVDVTRAAGLAEVARPTQAATWGDFDGDGELDLFVANEFAAARERSLDFPDELYLNRGDGTFSEEARERGANGDAFTKGVTAGDYDNDGDLDLYLSNIGPNQLFRNDGTGHFTEVAAEAGVSEPSSRSFACWFFDFDNDGDLDLFVGAYEASLADVAAEALGRPNETEPPRLYRNDGDDTFTDVARSMGLARPFKPMGANFGDIDHDGYLDIYLTTGEPQLQSLMPNVMLRNDRGRRFVDVTTAGGFGHLQKGHGVAFADLDQDGDQDVYHQLGGFFPVDRYQNALFENPGNEHHFLYLDLVGTNTNLRGVGARVRVVVSTPGGAREIHRAVGSVSSFGGSPVRQEIGLEQALRIDLLEVRWPNGGSVQRFEQVPLDRLVTVTEGEDELRAEELVPVPFAVGRGSASSTGAR